MPPRKFIYALKYDKERSTYVIERIQVRYALEQQMREQQLDWEEKTKLRQENSVPVLLELQGVDDRVASAGNPGGRRKAHSVKP